MIKYVYGLYDRQTGNIGDICILDRDEEFRDGCLRLFSMKNIPNYVVNDLIGLCYGFIEYSITHHLPKLVPFEIPSVIIRGDEDCVVSSRKEVESNEEIS